MVKIVTIALFAVALIPLNAYSAGTTTATFLNLEVSAAAEGMGSAYSAIADDASAVTINPAGMIQVPKQQVMVMHNEYLLDIDHEYFSYVTSQGDHAWGGSITYIDYGVQSEYDATNTFIGTFNPNSYALSIAYAAKYNAMLSYGVAVKYIKMKITESGSTFAVDGGLLYKLGETGWRFGAALSNLGGDIEFIEEGDPLPLTFKIGTAYQFDKMPLLASFDLYTIKEEDPEYHLGVQYTLQEMVNLRLGYNSNDDLDNGITYGIGLKQENFAVDYAFVPKGELGDSHRFSLNLNF